MAKSNPTNYNSFFTQTPSIITDHNDDIVKTMQRITTDTKKAIINIAATITADQEYETDKERAKLLAKLKQTQEALHELQGTRLEVVSDLQLLASIIQDRRLPETEKAADYAALFKKEKASRGSKTDYKGEAVKDRTMNMARQDVQEALNKAKQVLSNADVAEIAPTQADTEANMRCPVMLMVMKEPMRSDLCGHRYSKQGIYSLFKSSTVTIECPVAGCGRMIQRSNLILDQDFADEIEEFLEKKNKKRENGGAGGGGRGGGRGEEDDMEDI